jgi:gliding motility-associated-like protein
MKLITIALRVLKASISGLLFISVIFIPLIKTAIAQHPVETSKELVREAERLWLSIDVNRLKDEIVSEAGIRKGDVDLFFRYLAPEWDKDRNTFFRMVYAGELNYLNLDQFLTDVKNRYVASYPSFVLVKEEFARDIAAIENRVMDAAGKCVNMDFEDGNFNGWEGQVQSRGGRGGTGFIETRNGFGQHCIMTKTQRDPYIPDLSVVAPGGNYSVRLGNTEAGGHTAKLTQSFIVDSSNAILIYRYAVVLESPEDDEQHQGMSSPHFLTRLYDQNGNQISCGEYTVSVLGSNLSSYTHLCVSGSSSRVQINTNSGCGNTRPPAANAVSAPNDNDKCPNNRRDLYYRDWTTVAIALQDYIGQQVTVEFLASDCEPSGHFGYAYIDTECNSLSVAKDTTICSYKETKVLTGPPGFKSYEWGPAEGIVGPSNNQSVTINKAGVYTLKLTTISDNSCVVNLTYTVTDQCDAREYTASLCESEKGSGMAEHVDLSTFNTIVTEDGLWGTVQSWHSMRPTASNSYAMSLVNDITITDAAKYYAITVLPERTDTVAITFTINALPEITFPPIDAVCEGSPAYKIPGVLPEGGVFSGTGINTDGVFTPATAGSFDILYEYTDLNGCSASVARSVEVVPLPDVEAGPPQMLCEDVTTINLNDAVTNAVGAKWTGGAGGSFSTDEIVTSYFVTAEDRNAGSILFTLSSPEGICPSVKDEVLITLEKIPLVDAGTGGVLCESNPLIKLNGTSSNSPGVSWSGGTASGFVSPTSLGTEYLPTVAEINEGSVTLILTSTGTLVCPPSQSSVVYTFEKVPFVDAGPDISVCENNSSIVLHAVVGNATGGIWSGGNGVYTPSEKDLEVTYQPTQEEIDEGKLFLTITTEGTTVCPPVSDQVQITILPAPVVDAGPDDTVCIGLPQVDLRGMSSTGTAIWSGNGTFGAGASSLYYTPTNEELALGYAILVLTSDQNGKCLPVSDTMKVIIEPLPSVNLGDDLMGCVGAVLSVTASGSRALHYTWEEGGLPLPETSEEISVVVKDDTLSYVVTGTDSYGCEAKDTIDIIGIPEPQVSLSDTAMCSGNAVVLDSKPVIEVASNSLPVIFTWHKDGTVIQDKGSSLLTVTEPGMYAVTVRQGSCSGSAQALVRNYPVPEGVLPDKIKHCFETENELELNAGNGYTYLWSPSGETTQKILVTMPGEYSVVLTNEYNCPGTDQVEVVAVCPPRLFISNSFSPNNDNINDQYDVFGAHIGKFRMLIFNRWGEVIFESNDKSIVWDGIYKGEPMVEGVYPWTIIYEGDSEEYKGPYTMTGSVTVVR